MACELRSEAFVKIKKKRTFSFLLGGGGGSRWGGGGVTLGWGQVGCEWRSEAFVRIKKKFHLFFFIGGGDGGLGQGGGDRVEGVRVYGNRIEACVKSYSRYKKCDPPTHPRSKSNMPHQLFQSWGHN